MLDETDDSGGDDGDGGKSFAELKQEYESGDADWAEEEEGTENGADEEDDLEDVDMGEDALADDSLDDADVDMEDALLEDDDDGDLGSMGDDLDDMGEDALLDDDDEVVQSDDPHEALPSVGDETDEGNADENAAGGDGAVLEEPDAEEDDVDTAEAAATEEPDGATADAEAAETAQDAATDTSQTAATSAAADAAMADAASADTGQQAANGPGKPYLATLPEGYTADILIVEWLEFLVGESDVRETMQALQYYERIDWIDEAVADDLRSFLSGFDGAEGDGGTLTIDHHTQSLRYISQLSGDTADRVAMDLLQRGRSGGGGDGLQR